MRTFHALVSLSEEKGKSREKQVNGARDTSDSESFCYDSPSYEKTLRSPVAHMRADSKIILRRAISFISTAIMLGRGGYPDLHLAFVVSNHTELLVKDDPSMCSSGT